MKDFLLDAKNLLITVRISTINLIKKQWQIRGWLSLLLFPLSLLTITYLWINSRLYENQFRKTHHFKTPIIVVGNVVVGGAGKTPVVIELVNHLSQTGRQVGVVSKGYGRLRQRNTNQQFHALEVQNTSSCALVGDEPKLIYLKTGVPVFVGDDRAQTVKALLDKYPNTDIVISDDGLQHHALGRDINVVVFDSTGLGNGLLLPSGPLRETWPRAYKNAQTEFILSTNEGKAPMGFKVLRTLSNFAFNKSGQKLDLREPRNTRFHALAGIARPEIFFEMLIDKGLNLSETTLLEDHATFNVHHFNLTDDASVKTNYPETTYLCTEKDAVKIWEFNPDVWAVPLICTLDPKFVDELEDSLVQLRRSKA